MVVAVWSLSHVDSLQPHGLQLIRLSCPSLSCLLEFVQAPVHLVSGVIQPSHLLLPPSPPALNLPFHRSVDSELTPQSMCAHLLSSVPLCAPPWTAAHQAPLTMGFSRQGYWRGSPCPPPGDLPHLGIEPGSLALQADSLSSEPPGNQESHPMRKHSDSARLGLVPVLLTALSTPVLLVFFSCHFMCYSALLS